MWSSNLRLACTLLQLERNGTVVPTNGPAQALVQPTVHFGGPGQLSLAMQAEFNPIRWLAQRLIRGKLGHHDKSEYEEQLLRVADARRQERLKLETKVRQDKEDAASLAEQEASEKKYQDNMKASMALKQLEQGRADRISALETLRAERSGDLVKNDADLAHKLAALRAQCTDLIDKHDFAAAAPADASPLPSAERAATAVAASLEQLEGAIQYAVVEWLCTNSVASYVAAAVLVGDKAQDLLHTVAAVALEAEVPVEAVADNEGEEGGEEPAQEVGEDGEPLPPPKPERVRTVERMALAEYGADTAYLLPLGEGLTYKPVVQRRDHLLLPDAKFAEGVFFFDGEKKPGLLLSPPSPPPYPPTPLLLSLSIIMSLHPSISPPMFTRQHALRH